MAWCSSSSSSLTKIDDNSENMAILIKQIVSQFELTLISLVSLFWVLALRSHLHSNYSEKPLLLFNLFIPNLCIPLFAFTNPARLCFWFYRYLTRIRPESSAYNQDDEKRKRQKRFVFWVERLGMLWLYVPHLLRVQGTVLYFTFCAIPCVILFPLANFCYIRLSLQGLSGGVLNFPRFWNLFSYPTIDPLIDEFDNEELNETTSDLLDPVNRNNNNNITDLEAEEEEKTEKEEEAKVDGKTEEESHKSVLSSDGESSFVVIRHDEQQQQQLSKYTTLSPAEHKLLETDTSSSSLLSLSSSESDDYSEYEENTFSSFSFSEMVMSAAEWKEQREKMKDLEKQVSELKLEGQEMEKSVENLKKSFEELTGCLADATRQIEFLRIQAQEDKETIGRLRQDKTRLTLLFYAANASSELYRTLLHDYQT